MASERTVGLASAMGKIAAGCPHRSKEAGVHAGIGRWEVHSVRRFLARNGPAAGTRLRRGDYGEARRLPLALSLKQPSGRRPG